MTKILLNENEIFSSEVINEYARNYEKGRSLLSMLKNLGYEAQKVDKWDEVEQHFMLPFPKATLSFNLQAQGIEAEYLAAKAFHHRGGLSYVRKTAEQEEAIRESQRIYASTETQIEAYNVIHRIIEDLNRLESLGLNLAFQESYLISRAFDYYPRSEVSKRTVVNQRHLVSEITRLK